MNLCATQYGMTGRLHWVDTGSLSDYWKVLQRVMRGELAQMPMRGKQVRPGFWVGLNTCVDCNTTHIEDPVYIGSGVLIEPGAQVIGPTWIGHASHLRAACSVERSLLIEYTRIGTGQTVSGQTMLFQYCVDQYGETLYLADEDTHIT